MGLPNEVNSALIGAANQGGYTIDYALRFIASKPSRLTYDNSSGTNNSSSAWTLSFWMKRGADAQYSTWGSDLHMMMWTPSGSCANTEYFLIADPQHGTTAIRNSFSFNGGSYYGNIKDKQRDVAKWYHVVWRGNTGSSSNIIYINNEVVTDYNQGPSGQTPSYVNGQSRWSIGDSYTGCGSSPFDGYITEVHFVDGSTLNPTEFGETDSITGQWIPKQYTGSYGTNGYYLKMDPTAANGVGHDHSGNGHHWTATNITTSGVDTGVVTDTPTSSFPTFSPYTIWYAGFGETYQMQDGNLGLKPRQSYSGNWTATHGTWAIHRGGKWYWELRNSGGTNSKIGVYNIKDATTSSWNQEVSSRVYMYKSDDGQKVNTSGSAYGASWNSAGDIIGVAFDADNGTITFYKNGTSQGQAFSGMDTTAIWTPYFLCEDNGSARLDVNFGQRDFSYTVPSGYKTFSSDNFSTPAIADGTNHQKTALWTGNSTGGAANQDISGLNFQPDLVILKSRFSGSANWHWYDNIRGAGKALFSNNEDTEHTNYSRGYLDEFRSDGFGVTTGSTDGRDANGLSSGSPPDQYVGHCWLGGNGTVSNTDGTLTSTVSANTEAGISIVTYTADNTAGRTVGHGLNSAPQLIFIRNRNRGSTNMRIYHEQLGNTKCLLLPGAGTETDTSLFNNTSPNSTTFTIGNGAGTGQAYNYVAWCFHEVEGFSRIGLYTGNGSNDRGTYVHCGFKPQWIMTKAYTTAQEMFFTDDARNPYNVSTILQRPNLTNAEINDPGTGGSSFDIYSNGFMWYTSTQGLNGGDYPYVFAAFAEKPFEYANAN